MSLLPTLSLIGIPVSILVTFIVSRYYFRKSIDVRRLVIGNLGTSSLVDIDKSVAGDLDIFYNGELIDRLYKSRLVIGNGGNVTLSTSNKPISIAFPVSIGLIDANVAERSAKAREATLMVDLERAHIDLSVEFLNPGDCFSLDITSTEPLPRPVEASLAIPGLPPTATTKDFEKEWLFPPEKPWQFGKIREPMVGALFLLPFSAVLAFADWLLWHSRPEAFPWPFVGFEQNVMFPLALLLIGIQALFIGVIGFVALLAGLVGLQGDPDRPYFELPSNQSHDGDEVACM